MSESNICGKVSKQSRLGLSWNTRYLVVKNDHINIYNNENESKNGKCKYCFNVAESKMNKLNEQNNEVKMEISSNDNKKHRFQMTKDLWILLAEFYTNIHNPNTPQITTEITTEHSDVLIPIDSEYEEVLNDSEKEDTLNDSEKDDIDTLNDSDNEHVIFDEIKTEETEIKYQWNHKYRNMLDNDEKDEYTKALVFQFCSISKIHCIDLIENTIFVHNQNNVNLDELQRTYIRDDIEFKIITSENEYHQLKSLITNLKKYEEAFDGDKQRLYCPLSCIVEYMNCKIYCKASLPMTTENLVFGKSFLDTTFTFNEKISELLDKAAKKLNLATHSCKYNPEIDISTSSNIRVHETEDNVYYIDNISELYPIDIVHFMKNVRKPDRKLSAFSTVLHPKLVELSSVPVSCDAFVPPIDDKHDQIASRAIYNLHSNIIPKFVENINSLKTKIVDAQTLQQLMFNKGIRMIYIGEIYNLCTVRYAKEIIGILMLAQTIKQEINNQLITSKDEYQEKVNYYINCFTNDDDSYTIELGIKEKLISLTNYNFGTCLNTAKVNKLPFKYVEYELNRILNAVCIDLCLSVSDKYIGDIADTLCDESGNNIVSIQKECFKLQDSKSDITDCATFEEFRVSCLSLMNKIDLFFPFHFLKFDVMNTMVAVYSAIIKQENKAEMVDHCCSLYCDRYNLCKLLFGRNHRQTLLIKIELIKLLYSNKKDTDSVEVLSDLLQSIYSVFGKTSLHSVIVLKILSEKYFEKGNYGNAIDYAKQHILILDDKKRFNNDEYIGAHLRISLIAEKIEDYSLGIRFLNKLYNHLKKSLDKESNHQKLFQNLDIKLLSLSISRMKLKMSNKHKLKEMQTKWKAFHDNNLNNHSMEEYNKCKELIIQNLCLNPIKKSNDLLKSNADTFQIICWVNIIKEFEVNFLKIKDQYK